MDKTTAGELTARHIGQTARLVIGESDAVGPLSYVQHGRKDTQVKVGPFMTTVPHDTGIELGDREETP